MRNFSLKLRYVFIACMFVLISLFLFGFINSPNGPQGNVFPQTDNNFADHFLVSYYSADGNPYLNGRPNINDRPYLPLSYILHQYIFSKTADFFNLTPIEASQNKVANMVVSLFFLAVSIAFFIQLYNLTVGNGIYKIATIFALMFSGVYLYAYGTGNLTLLTAVFIIFFITNYSSSNPILKELSCISLALAGALKLSPLFITILLLYDKDYKSVIKIGFYFLLFGILPFFIYEEGFLHTFYAWVKCVKSRGSGLSFPIYLGIKFLDEPKRQFIYSILKTFTYSVSIIGLITNYFQKTQWKKICLIMCILVILFAGDVYTITYMFPMIVLFLNEKKCSMLFGFAYLLSFILLLNPYQIPRFNGLSVSWFLMKAGFWILFLTLTLESVISFIKYIKTKKT